MEVIFCVLVAFGAPTLVVLSFWLSHRCSFCGPENPALEKEISDLLDFGTYEIDDKQLVVRKESATLQISLVYRCSSDYGPDEYPHIVVATRVDDKAWTTEVWNRELWYRVREAIEGDTERKKREAQRANDNKVLAVVKHVTAPNPPSKVE